MAFNDEIAVMNISDLVIKTTEMHTGGEPLRIVESGYPKISGETILEKRKFVKENFDFLRKFLMFEPRGHFDMYGALLIEPDNPEADMAVLFMHNEGYSTMCGHAVIALGRYALDKGLARHKPSPPETEVNIQCPCGLVKAFVECNHLGETGRVRFHSVPSFLFAADVKVSVPGYGELQVDIAYGGAFYAFVTTEALGLNFQTNKTSEIVDAASKVTEAVKSTVKLHHPDSPDLAFLYGTIVTDGKEEFSQEPTANICVFADRQVDRCPTGSGVTARIALQFAKGLISIDQERAFENGCTGSRFTGKAIRSCKAGTHDAVVVEVSGNGYYTGSCTFIAEAKDMLKEGFILN
ncbi:trans-L-3-hydroxyproline dehydratase-like [Lingula anatina]|uniref:trans-L-3-hydroxyproline dehydratase n=1 Tax=Lingula anatina TaxID=7574 RepID=A0A1S3J6Y6_LINAN|nr:trans-L-3-hydroxyproline dehydratase-like [Lingula anatina]|eukprot:XP_013406160.1 trans-L-3-hydroxyproline dehydratase-like [Lingula anatina]